jgi:hypothetical protein
MLLMSFLSDLPSETDRLTDPGWPIASFWAIQPLLTNPLFPASGPVTGSFNGLHWESKFLAITGFEKESPVTLRTGYHVGASQEFGLCRRRV